MRYFCGNRFTSSRSSGRSSALRTASGPASARPSDHGVTRDVLHQRCLRLPPQGDGARSQCHPIGHAVEPVAQQMLTLEASCLSNEHEKRRLKGVIDVVGIAQELAANAQDHGSMALHQRLERRLVARTGEPVQKLPLGKTRQRAFTKQSLHLMHHDAARSVANCTHGATPPHADALVTDRADHDDDNLVLHSHDRRDTVFSRN